MRNGLTLDPTIQLIWPFEFVDKVTRDVGKYESTLDIFLDLSKAFDTNNHDISLYELENYGLKGSVLVCF